MKVGQEDVGWEWEVRMTFKTEYEEDDGEEGGEEAKRAEGELMEESFGSGRQVTHRGWRRPFLEIAPHVFRPPPLLQRPLK